MTYNQIVQTMAIRLSINEDEVQMILSAFLSTLSDELQKGNDIFLPHFGELHILTCYDTDSEQDVWYKTHTRNVIFSAAAELQERINRW